MATGSYSPVPIALGSPTTETEEGRAFFQERVGRFGMWVFFISGGFYVMALGLGSTLDPRFNWPTTPFTGGQLFHLLGTLVVGGVWLAASTTVLPGRALRTLDAAAVILASSCFALMGGALGLDQVAPIGNVHVGIFVGLLGATFTVIARAIAVPSTLIRSVWIGASALAPVTVVSYDTLTRAGESGPMLIGAVVHVACWCIAGVAISAVGSNAIFGLRAEVDKIKRLGQYTLEEKLGEGGMGVVYRARHAMLRRPCALKLLPPEKAGEESLHRFEREVQLTAQLSHPSTIAIYDYGRTPQGVFYYVMEFLDGLNLEELVRMDGPQTPGRVIDILQQVCGALAEAHDIGLIHRDIKPANIILTARGGMPDVAKVLDFGLVKQIEAAETDATLAVSRANVVTGTPLYLAPEAIKGNQFIDARSDLYALGAVGYYLLTGAPVFESGTVVEIFAHHLHTAPTPPSQRASQRIPAELEAAIVRCLSKDPEARPKDAGILRRALADCPCSIPWSIDDASRWWATYEAERGPPRDRAAAERSARHETVMVDLADRVAGS